MRPSTVAAGHLGDESRFWEEDHCSLLFQSSKAHSFTHVMARESGCEAMVLDDLCLWVVRNWVRVEKELAARYPPVQDHVHSRKALTFKEHGSILNAAGVPGELVRSPPGSNTPPQDSWMDCSERISTRGDGWAKGSSTPAGAYINRSVTYSKHTVEKPSGKPPCAWARTGAAGTSALTIDRVRPLSSSREEAAKSLALQSL